MITELEELKAEAEKRAERLKEEAEKRRGEEEAYAEEVKRLKEELEREAAEVVKEEEEEEPQTIETKPLPKKTDADQPASEPAKREEDKEVSAETKGEEQPEPVMTEEPIEPVPSKEVVLRDTKEPTEYVTASFPALNMTLEEFTSTAGRSDIENVIGIILEAEAPILKEALIRKVLAGCGINRSGAAVDAVEKAMKRMKVKTSKTKGVVFCWTPGQDPKEYDGIRVSNDRSGDEISPQEITNAACYVLKSNPELSKDDLIKEVSRVFGYKRLGKNLEASLAAGIQFARSSGAIKVEGVKYSLN